MHPIHLVGLYTTRLPVFRWKARGYDWILVDSIGQPSNSSDKLSYYLSADDINLLNADNNLIFRFHRIRTCLKFEAKEVVV